ncbi:MAG TPA: ACP S-malonyltransferase [Steroidobacteraceae bacterium]
MTVAMVFPGQGSQAVGMLAALAENFAPVRETFAEASTVLGYDLWQRVAHGPEEALNATACTQPAMLAAGVATWRAWRAAGGAEPALVAGHSLGEFSALVCAGTLPFGAAIGLVRVRGELMQAAVPAGSGAMAAILGLEAEVLLEVCAQSTQGEVVEAVNFNGPGQIVIAGHASAVARAVAAAKERGAKRALLLPVSVPSHSSLMRPAAERFRPYLEAVAFQSPRYTYISAVDAREYRDPNQIRELLGRQLASPVRWTETVLEIIRRGAKQLLECGPGKVLTGLNRRIGPRGEISCAALEDPESIRAALGAAAGGGDAK